MVDVGSDKLGGRFRRLTVIKEVSTAPQTATETLRHDGRGMSTRLTAADVMTVAEVADLLHVPRSTISDWARRGIIPSVKIGRRRIYVRQQIEAVLLQPHAR